MALCICKTLPYLHISLPKQLSIFFMTVKCMESKLIIPNHFNQSREANSIIKLLATKIALKWEKPLSEVTGWVRATLAFAILRATNLCIRGSRVKWRSAVHMDDGAGLPTSAYE